MDYDKINGYNELSDENKVLFERFLHEFLEERENITPRSIKFIEEEKYGVLDSSVDRSRAIKRKFYSFNRGVRSLTSEQVDLKEKSAGQLKLLSSEKYLKFDYSQLCKKGCIHIEENGDWYLYSVSEY